MIIVYNYHFIKLNIYKIKYYLLAKLYAKVNALKYPFSD